MTPLDPEITATINAQIKHALDWIGPIAFVLFVLIVGYLDKPNYFTGIYRKPWDL